MKNIWPKIKNSFYLFVLVTFVLFFLFSPYIISNMPLTYGTDIKTQWFEFYTEFSHLIKNFFLNHDLPFYSWTTFLGANFWASRSYYLIGDIFNYISLLFRTNFFNSYLIITILKIYVASFTCYYLLTIYEYQTKTKFIGSLCYAFSGWAIFYSGQLSFLSFYCFVPLYFAGIELYLRKKHTILFVFACALLLFTNFYFFYTISFFTPIYYIYRYSLIKDNYKKFIHDTVIIIGLYLLGVIITGALTIPTILYLLDNNRVGVGTHLLLYVYNKLYLHELVAMLVPNYLYLYKTNIFEIDWHVVREICMYAGSVIAIFLFQLLFDKNKKFRNHTLIFYLVMILIMICPAANSAMHGFSDPSLRWLFLFILMNILTACKYIDDFDSLNKKPLILISSILGSLAIIIIPISALITEGDLSLAYTTYLPQTILFSVFGLLYLSYSVLFRFNNKKIMNIILLITVCEFSVSGYILSEGLVENSSYTWDFIDNATSVLQEEDGAFNAFLNGLDEENYSIYYRVYVDLGSIYWDFSLNMNQIYQIQGVSTYDSIYSPSFNDTVAISDVGENDVSWNFYIKNDELIDFLNVKYLVVTDDAQLPVNGNFTFVDYYSGLLVYVNNDYRVLGTSYNNVISYEDYKDLYNNDLSMLKTTIIAHEEDYDEINSLLSSQNNATLEYISYSGNQLHGTANSDDRSFMVITLPYDSGWKIMVNDKEVKTYSVNGGYLGFAIENGLNTIDMYFIPNGFKLGLILSVTGTIAFGGLIILALRKRNTIKKNNKKD